MPALKRRKLRADFRDRRDVGDFVRFCFAKPKYADTFAARFGGERIDVARIGAKKLTAPSNFK